MTLEIKSPATVVVPVSSKTEQTAQTVKKNLNKLSGKQKVLLLATLSTLAVAGAYLVNKNSHKPSVLAQDKPKIRGFYCQEDIPKDQQGGYGQNKYDPNDPRNNDDPESPFYHRRGAFGQDIYDPNNPYNKQDPLSPYYDPNNKT